MKNYTIIGPAIKKGVIVSGINQKQLAERLGVTQGTVSTWVRGTKNPTFAQVCALADCLEISMATFCQWNEEFRPTKTKD